MKKFIMSDTYMQIVSGIIAASVVLFIFRLIGWICR